ncbi:hypothetical protein [Kineococcus vitellinus]|uniref:hypothetical protein n=1 Tax=Kineococcus vitellinus TaxID=2696565 RepID=UPI00196AC2C5|nr:hypothetical protein [Kineococcus vitellinus]
MHTDVIGAVLLGTAVVLLATTGLVIGVLRGDRLRLAQAPSAVVFTGAGLLATGIDPRIGVVVIAGGLVLHACWDAVHWWSERVVQRSFAEWCGVLDLTVGVGLLLLL